MLKSLLIISWTLLVAAAAFTLGRVTLGDTLTQGNTEVMSVTRMAPAVIVPTANTAVPVSLQKLPSALRNHTYAADAQQLQLLIALAATNPALAMEKTRQFNGAIKAKAEAAILEVWGSIDPNGAWNWVQLVQPENNVQLIKLLEVIGRTEPRTAMSYAEKYVESHGELRKDIYSSLVAGIIQNGAYDLAIDLVGRLAIEAETKAELTNSILSLWAAYEPQATMQWMMTQPEEVKVANIDRLGEAWADADPQGAVNFAAMQSGATRESLLLPAFKKWLATDAAAATTWLSAAQRHKDFDQIIVEVATQPSTTNTDVKAALVWAGQVHDAELRVSAVTSILSAFKQKDPHTAATYLQEITYLTDSERTRLAEDLAFHN
jgi:hypothetical protein